MGSNPVHLRGKPFASNFFVLLAILDFTVSVLFRNKPFKFFSMMVTVLYRTLKRPLKKLDRQNRACKSLEKCHILPDRVHFNASLLNAYALHTRKSFKCGVSGTKYHFNVSLKI